MCSICYLQLEERIDTLSKEARASKTNTEVAQQQISELKEEVQQVRHWVVSYPRISLGTSATSADATL